MQLEAEVIMKGTRTKKRQLIPAIITLVAIAFIAYALNELDKIVHVQLYNYGLRFSSDWALPYWTLLRTIQILLGIVMLSTAVNLLLTRRQTRSERQFSKAANNKPLSLARIASWLTLIFGGVLLTLSIISESLILAFIGLGLAFWGVVLLYATPQEYVKSVILGSTTVSLLTLLHRIITDGKYTGTAVYLPPKYLKYFESSKVYLTKNKTTQLPMPEQIQEKENEILGSDPESILLTPPGEELERLLEKTLGTHFTKINLDQLERNLPKLIVEDLEFAQNVEIEVENPIFRMKIGNSVDRGIAGTLRELTPTVDLLGSPIGSAIACAIAKASGRPVIIREHEISEDSRTTTIEYLLLEDEKSEQTSQ